MDVVDAKSEELMVRRLELLEELEKVRDQIMVHVRAIAAELDHRNTIGAIERVTGRTVSGTESAALREMAEKDRVAVAEKERQHREAAVQAKATIAAAWREAKAKGAKDKNAWEAENVAKKTIG